MPVLTKESEAGSGEKSVSIPLSEVVLVAVTLSNDPLVVDRAEASEILLYSGTDTEGINYLRLRGGWTAGKISLNWSGRLHLRGEYMLVGTINHVSATVKHRLTVMTEMPGLEGRSIWEWEKLWGSR